MLYKCEVIRTLIDQFFVRARFRTLSVLYEYDFIGVPDCRQPMRDNNDSLPFGKIINILHDPGFGGGIQR